jgi:hypothetical protein
VADHKKDLVAVPNIQQRKIIVKPVGDNHTVFEKGNTPGALLIIGFSIADMHICWQISIIIEQGLYFDGSFNAPSKTVTGTE